MKQTIKLRESELKRMISESVKRVLREMDNDYEGNDLDYDSIQMQAMSVIPRMHQNGQDVSWRSVAEEMGFRLETLNGEDMELLKDAIEDTMMEDENPYYREDADFENDFQNLPYANESINRIINESVKKVVNEIGDTRKGQYMLGRLRGRQLNNGNRQQASDTHSYAMNQMKNKFGNRTDKNFSEYDTYQTSHELGTTDETNPQLSKDMLTNGGNIGTYYGNVRDNYLKGVSKFH